MFDQVQDYVRELARIVPDQAYVGWDITLNEFLKATFNITENINVFADVQYRGVRYVIEGNNDKFIKDSNGDYQNQILDIDERFNFFNPKAGISYVKDYMNAYISFARTSKEPTRNNYIPITDQLLCLKQRLLTT